MKIITFLIALIIASFSNYAQTTGFNYQAVVHNSDGELVKNQDVSVLIDILENSASGSVIFSELHNIPTNSYGVLNIKVGLGNNILGDISTIDWSDNDYFLQVSIDLTGGNDYKLIGATQVLSVPSAL